MTVDNSFVNEMRDRIYASVMAAARVQLVRDGSNINFDDEDGIKYWQVSGSELDGVSASFADADDVIEFGLLTRVDGHPTNILHATIVIDSDHAEIDCVSDTRDDMNFSRTLKAEPDGEDGLAIACQYFAEITNGDAI